MSVRSFELTVGSGDEARSIAIKHRPGGGRPPLMWLGGFMSDMEGSKAVAVDALAAQTGGECVRFDYSGHGASSGKFTDGTISRWLEEAEAVYDQCCTEPAVLIGSSMGGWIALLLARRIVASTGKPPHALVLIAPASDMTEDLMWENFTESQRRDMMASGRLERPSDYADSPYIFTRELIEDGRQHLIHDQLIRFGCPIFILQGAADTDVPWQHAIKLMQALADESVILTIVKNGDHRLSRGEDIDRLSETIRSAQKLL